MQELDAIFPNKGVMLLALIWILFWKGCALWFSVERKQKKWFAALLIINTFGILEIVYIFFVAKKKWSDIRDIFRGAQGAESGGPREQ